MGIRMICSVLLVALCLLSASCLWATSYHWADWLAKLEAKKQASEAALNGLSQRDRQRVQTMYAKFEAATGAGTYWHVWDQKRRVYTVVFGYPDSGKLTKLYLPLGRCNVNHSIDKGGPEKDREATVDFSSRFGKKEIIEYSCTDEGYTVRQMPKRYRMYHLSLGHTYREKRKYRTVNYYIHGEKHKKLILLHTGEYTPTGVAAKTRALVVAIKDVQKHNNPPKHSRTGRG